MRLIGVVVLGLGLGLGAPVRGQDTTRAVVVVKPHDRPLRLIVAGGMTVPTGGFSTYHDLGVQASASAVMKLAGQKVRLRPEVMYNRFGVLEDKVRALVSSSQVAASFALAAAQRSGGPAVARTTAAVAGPKLPDLAKLRDRAVSSLLATFANLEVPLGPRGFQPYLIGGVGAVSFRTDVTTVGAAIDGIQWGLNAGAGLRFRLGPIGAGLEARFREVPVDEARTFFKTVTAVPVSFSVVF